MSSVPELRRGLAELGFQVLQEQAVVDGGKVYSAFSAAYQGAPVENGPLYPYLGKLIPGTPMWRTTPARCSGAWRPSARAPFTRGTASGPPSWRTLR